MSTTEARALAQVWEQVKNWTVTMQIALARRILDNVDKSEASEHISRSEPQQKRGRPAAEMIGLGAGPGEPPSDEQVRQWIEEHRMEKYGP